MNQYSPEHQPNDRRDIDLKFEQKFKELLPGVQFEITAEMHDARIAVLEALTQDNLDPEVLRSIWSEYATIYEQAVDSKTDNNTAPQIHAQLQIATLIHKALIFREIGDIQRYGEELVDAEEYSFQMGLEEISTAISTELNSL